MGSPALRWAVPGPRGVVWLSTDVQILLLLIRNHQVALGPVTTGRLATALGRPSRGQLWNQLARLRQQGLIGFRAYPVMPRSGRERMRLGGRRRPSPGRAGRLLVWIPRPARLAYRVAIDDGLRWRDAVRIALTSTHFMGFTGRNQAERWWARRLRRGGDPLAARGRGARAGPRRGRPPVAIRAHCPAGHLVATDRWYWREGPPTWVAEYRGRCRVCQADVVERLEVELEADPPRPDSPEELADAGLRLRRRTAAASVLTESPGIRTFAQRLRLERDYDIVDLPEREP